MIKFNKTAFTKAQNTVVKSGNKVAETIQEMILMGLDYFVTHGDASILTETVNTCQAAKTVKANDVKAYIVAHAKVKWLEDDGVARFKKVGKGAPEVTIPQVSWYEFTKQGAVKPDLSVDTMLNSMIKKLAQALEGEGERKVRQGHEKAAQVAHDNLMLMLSTMSEQGMFPAKEATK